jgi:hypothetical protein
MPKLAEFSIKFDLEATMAQVRNLRQAVQEGVVVATQAGAQVLYDEVKGRAQGIAKSGNLARSIYQYRNKDEQRPGHAQYKISWRKGGKKKDASASDNAAQAGLPVAAHGILLEYGYIQRYVSYVGSDGNWYTRKKPGIKGKVPRYKGPPAGRRAHFDKYYVLRETPVQHAPRSFLRAGFEAAQGKALEASRAAMYNHIEQQL